MYFKLILYSIVGVTGFFARCPHCRQALLCRLDLDVNAAYDRCDGILAVDDFVLGVSHSLRSWVLVEMETMSGRGFLEDLPLTEGEENGTMVTGRVFLPHS